MLEMPGLGDNMTVLGVAMSAQGAGTVFLVAALLCFFIVKRIVKTRQRNNDPLALEKNANAVVEAEEAKKPAAVTAAIMAALTEYRNNGSS